MQDGIDFLGTSVFPIRESIKEFRYSHVKKAEFKALCVSRGLKPKTNFPLDTEIRWSSTYNLLITAYHYREALTSYYNRHHPECMIWLDLCIFST